MRVELLYFEGCPHYEDAHRRVERILARRGLAVPVELRQIESPEAVAGTGFLGSPTVLVNGKDVEVARRGEAPAFGCRTYESVQEGRSPLPPLAWIEAAIADALVEEGAEVSHCAVAPRASVQGNCPVCGAKGKAVWRVTLESLLTREALARLGPEEHLYCPSTTCDVVYFAPETGRLFRQTDLLVRIGAKEAEAPRPVCYCFGHSVETIEDEIRRTGKSTTVKSITESMRGGCRCEIVRPQSTCCLGDVTRAALEGAKKLAAAAAVVHAATGSAASSAGSDGTGDSCCAVPQDDSATERAGACGDSCPAPGQDEASARGREGERGAARTGVLAAVASVVSALVASACCWLPLLLVAVGASAAGVSAAFEKVRPYFLAGAAVLLAAGYYFVFLRKEECAPGSACAVPGRRTGRLNKAMLLFSTALVLAIALFPSYVGALLGADRPVSASPAPTAPARLAATTLKVEGMTCEGCTIHVRNALVAVSGVRSAEVRFGEGLAIVRHDAASPPSADALRKAVESAGYQASVISSDRAAEGARDAAPPKVHHLLLEVADLDRSIVFYRDQLELRLASRSGDFATLEAANVGVYLWQSRWDWEEPRRQDERVGLGMYPHLSVADVEATIARLDRAGTKIVQRPRRYDWGTEAFVADPDGYVWALVAMRE